MTRTAIRRSRRAASAAAPPPATASGSVVEPVGRAQEVREAALSLFASRGYHGTSMKDLAAALHLQAPSLYNHITTKQDILRDIMVSSMERLLRETRAALVGADDVAEQLHRATEAHVRFHARHPREVRIGNQEIPSLEEPGRRQTTELRRRYARLFTDLIERGITEGRFATPSARMATYAILQMGIGVSMWYRESGALSETEIAHHYGEIALRIVGAAGR